MRMCHSSQLGDVLSGFELQFNRDAVCHNVVNYLDSKQTASKARGQVSWQISM